MRDALPILLLLIVAPFVTGCQSNRTQSGGEPGKADPQHNELADLPAAYLDGRAVTRAELYRHLVPAHGGDALAEILIDRAVKNRLKQEAIELSDADIRAERDKLVASLAPDPDQAAKLLQEMRSQRGLDEQRFNALLRRNAGLRLLVRDQISVNEAAIEQAYTLNYGLRYQARIITANKLDRITQTRKQVLSGQSFTDLAIQRSTDISAQQGGLLSPISPADPTYPKAIRDALPKLSMETAATRLSSAIAMDRGYALLWLEGVVQKDAPSLEEVRIELAAAVRSELERVRMRQLARTLIEKADVVILDPTIQKAWQRQRESIRNP